VKAKNRCSAKSNWSDVLWVTIVDAPLLPILEIRSIGGSPFKITVVIGNNGSVDAKSVNWSITLDGGLILLGKHTTGRVITIPAGEEVTVRSKVIFGLGKTVITATADCVEGSCATEERDAFVFLFYIKILGE